MTWSPSEPIRASLLDFKLPARFFIEQDETTVDDRTGWATPRKRPRRVHKKLSKRAFHAHCRAPVIGTGAWSEKCRRWHGMAPKLAVWLRGGNPTGYLQESATVRFEPVMFDGSTLARPPYPALVLSTGRVFVETQTERAVFARIEHGPTGPIERQIEEWRGQAVACDLRVQKRPMSCVAVIFTPPGVQPVHAVVSAPIERAMDQIAHAMISAAQGVHETTVIARQTSYRPTPHILSRWSE